MSKIVSRNEAYLASKKRRKTYVPPAKPEIVEYPDDRVLRESTERVAAAHIDSFMTNLDPSRIRSLVLIYSDTGAEELLAEIREEFYTSLPDESRRPATAPPPPSA